MGKKVAADSYWQELSLVNLNREEEEVEEDVDRSIIDFYRVRRGNGCYICIVSN